MTRHLSGTLEAPSMKVCIAVFALDLICANRDVVFQYDIRDQRWWACQFSFEDEPCVI